jgi:L-amino acid N-acyltransferase YncA
MPASPLVRDARPAYRFTIEDSVYVADGLGGRGD